MIRQIHVDVCDSTQELLKEQTGGGNETILVSTDIQKKGHGRGSNVWEDLPGSVCFSMTIEPHTVLSLTALEISVLVARFFEFEGCKLGLKWPNDLLSRGIKCGGILVQGSGQQLIAGIGVNLFSDHPAYGGIYREPFDFDKKSWSLRIGEFIAAHRYVDSEALIKDWEFRCQHMGEIVTITEGKSTVEGIFLGLGASGEALMDTWEGKKSIYNGTLRFISSER